jgi:hypothetical protein
LPPTTGSRSPGDPAEPGVVQCRPVDQPGIQHVQEHSGAVAAGRTDAWVGDGGEVHLLGLGSGAVRHWGDRQHMVRGGDADPELSIDHLQRCDHVIEARPLKREPDHPVDGARESELGAPPGGILPQQDLLDPVGVRRTDQDDSLLVQEVDLTLPVVPLPEAGGDDRDRGVCPPERLLDQLDLSVGPGGRLSRWSPCGDHRSPSRTTAYRRAECHDLTSTAWLFKDVKFRMSPAPRSNCCRWRCRARRRRWPERARCWRLTPSRTMPRLRTRPSASSYVILATWGWPSASCAPPCA